MTTKQNKLMKTKRLFTILLPFILFVGLIVTLSIIEGHRRQNSAIQEAKEMRERAKDTEWTYRIVEDDTLLIHTDSTGTYIQLIQR